MMASNGYQPSYNNERSPSAQTSGSSINDKENDNSSDPASSSFFMNDYKKHDDLKQMLDSNKDNLKLEAMKRIIGMVAKGRDASELFPAVVKNVVSKNIEVKKLVYVYLTRYAEDQQDLALLSISTFQRALKDPNQLIRGSAIRVLSSIRVPMIAPIVMLSIKESVSDMSPYVRRSAAHAIPKLYTLDPDQKEVLIEVIEKLLADKTTLVAGSAIQAFEEVCPERIDLIHRNYRKLCNLLVDVEEWGQVVIINMLTRYCRTQFINPNLGELCDENDSKAFYESDDSNISNHKPVYSMDADHRLLLKTCRPLLNSRNSAVVMGVAQLYHHCAPKSEISTVAKALVRLLRSHKEVQFVVLTNIASMSIKQKSIFEPHLKNFYVRYNDPTHVKLLKLEILTNLSTEANISTVLREFQTYVSSPDKEFAAATIQAIGRCATTIAEVTETCLNGLVNLLSNRNEAVVGESVVVIKKLLQMKPTEHKDIVSHMAKMVEKITVPMAKASILWLIGEYSDRVPKLAPDVLRKMAKSFINEEDLVKLQIMNLATKLCIMNPKQTSLLCQYVLNLAKYDLNYDIRDRARFLRQIVQPKGVDGDHDSSISKNAKKIFLASKPAPVLTSKFKDLENFQLGTLSHMIGTRANEYQELPEWPESAPDTSVRNVEMPISWSDNLPLSLAPKKHEKKKAFYSDDESSSEESSSESSLSSDESEKDKKVEINELDSNESSSSSDDETSSESSSEDDKNNDKEISSAPKTSNSLISISTDKDNGNHKKYETIEEDESEDSRSSNDSETNNEEAYKTNSNKNSSKMTNDKNNEVKIEDKRPSQYLLDLEDFVCAPNLMNITPLLPLNDDSLLEAKPQPNYNFLSVSQQNISSKEVLNRMVGSGVSINCAFPRTISIFNQRMVAIQLDVTNHNNNTIEFLKIENKKLGTGMKITDISEIKNLAANNTSRLLFYVDFNDSIQTLDFDLVNNITKFPFKISVTIGELLRPNTVNEKDFFSLCNKLGGMNEISATVSLSSPSPTSQDISDRVLRVGNVLFIGKSAENIYLFAAKTVSSEVDILTRIEVTLKGEARVQVNCEKIIIGSMLLKELKDALSENF